MAGPDERATPVGVVARADFASSLRPLRHLLEAAERGAAELGEVPAHVARAVAELAKLESAATAQRLSEEQAVLAADMLDVLRLDAADHAALALEESGRIRSRRENPHTRILELAARSSDFRTAYGHQHRAEQMRRMIDHFERSLRRPEPALDGGPLPSEDFPGCPDEPSGPSEGGPKVPGISGGLGAPPGPGGAGPGASEGPGAPLGPGGPPGPPRVLPGWNRLPLPNLYPDDPHQRTPGRLPRPGEPGWLRRQGRRAWRSAARRGAAARRLARYATLGLGGNYLHRMIFGSPAVAEGYEDRLLRLWSERRYITGRMAQETMAALDNEPPPFAGDRVPWEDTGLITLRQSLDFARSAFLATGEETLRTMEALSGQMTLRRAMASLQMARATGLAPERVARFVRTARRYARHTNASLTTTTGSAMIAAGERRRPELFLQSVETYSQALGTWSGGFAEYADAAGYAALMGQLGYGARPEQGRQLLVGARARRNETVFAAKIAAVRALGPTKIGAGEGAIVADPSTYTGAVELIESGDPKTLGAYADYALTRADRQGLKGGERLSYARDIFMGLIGRWTPAAARIWEARAALRDVRRFGTGPGLLTETTGEKPGEGPPRWTTGPQYGGAMGPGRMRAIEDRIQHYLGRRIARTAVSIKDAMITALSVWTEGSAWDDAVAAANSALTDDARMILVAEGLLSGTAWGKGRAAALLAGRPTWIEREVDRAREGWSTVRSASYTHWPIAGPVTSGYGMRGGDEHQGIDIRAPVGLPVVAVGNGTVTHIQSRADWEHVAQINPQGAGAAAGAYVEVTHPDGKVSRYLHLDETTDETGAPLRIGTAVLGDQQIGVSGATGIRKSRPHLHFEIRQPAMAGSDLRYGPAMDPRTILPLPQ